MKAFPCSLAILCFAHALAAAERPGPQPRVRLDPETHVAITPAAPVPVSTTPAIMMEKFIVKASGIPLVRPAPASAPPEKFTVLRGGGIASPTAVGGRVEIGFWPNISLTVTDSPFRPRAAPRLDADLIHLKF